MLTRVSMQKERDFWLLHSRSCSWPDEFDHVSDILTLSRRKDTTRCVQTTERTALATDTETASDTFNRRFESIVNKLIDHEPKQTGQTFPLSIRWKPTPLVYPYRCVYLIEQVSAVAGVEHRQWDHRKHKLREKKQVETRARRTAPTMIDGDEFSTAVVTRNRSFQFRMIQLSDDHTWFLKRRTFLCGTIDDVDFHMFIIGYQSTKGFSSTQRDHTWTWTF